MLTIISPAKTLDFETKFESLAPTTLPDDVQISEQIIKKLRSISKKKLGEMMSINKDLVELNVTRYHNWSSDIDEANTQPALLAFNGEVYRGINAKEFSASDMTFAQDHLRILSGLYGLLRPLDQMQAYRLEMGTSLKIGRNKNLYELWSKRVTDRLNEQLAQIESDVLINLASTEYSKVVDFKKINGRVITPVFKDLKNGEYKVVMTWAKNARGMMAGYIVRNKLTDPNDLKGFSDYAYNEPMSTDDEWVFTRE